MNKIVQLKCCLLFFILTFPQLSFGNNLKCGKNRGEPGANALIEVVENFSVDDLPSIPPSSPLYQRYWEDIATEAQEVHGNNYLSQAYGVGIKLRIRGRALVGPSSMPIATRMIRTPSDITLYEAIAIEVGFEPDPDKVKEYQKDCEQKDQESDNNNDQTSSTGGGGGGYYYVGGAPLWSGVVYVAPRYSSTVDCQQFPEKCQGPDERALF